MRPASCRRLHTHKQCFRRCCCHFLLQAAAVAIANIYYGCIHMVDLGAWPWACYTAVLALIVGASLAKDTSDWLRCAQSGAGWVCLPRCTSWVHARGVQGGCEGSRHGAASTGRAGCPPDLLNFAPALSKPPPRPCPPACRARQQPSGTPKSGRVLLPSPVKSHDVEAATAVQVVAGSPRAGNQPSGKAGSEL